MHTKKKKLEEIKKGKAPLPQSCWEWAQCISYQKARKADITTQRKKKGRSRRAPVKSPLPSAVPKKG